MVRLPVRSLPGQHVLAAGPEERKMAYTQPCKTPGKEKDERIHANLSFQQIRLSRSKHTFVLAHMLQHSCSDFAAHMMFS